MTDPAAPAFHVDSPVSWRPESPGFDITGWLYAGPDGQCLDVRARVDRRAHLGIYGLDRPDTQQVFGGGIAALRTGFIQRVQVWRGARELALDFHDGNDWREFFRTKLDTSALPASARKPARVLRAAVVYQSLQYLYRHFHRENWNRLCQEADRVLRDILTATSDTADGPQVRGFIENPGYWVNANYDKFRITGWTFSPGEKPGALHVTVGVTTENRLVYPKERPDVAAHHPAVPESLKSGFYGLVDLPAGSPSPVNLKIFSNRPEGGRRLLFARRMHLDRHDEHSGPIPVFRPALFYKVVAAFLRSRLTGGFVFDSWPEARSEIRRLREHLDTSLGRGEKKALPAAVVRRRDQDPYTRWCWHNRLTPRLRRALGEDAVRAVHSGGPLLSMVVPAYNTPEKYLRELIDCLRRQIYPRWELCITDDASTQPHVRRILSEASRADARIKPVYRSENGHIARASNSALEIAAGEFVALLDHDDVLPDDALLHVAEAILAHPGVGYLYTDEDKIDDHGRRFDPQLKGAWSPEMAITHNYTHHLSVIRRDLIEKAGRLRPEFNGAQDIDLFLRCWELAAPEAIVHVPFVCYHWRAHAESTATRGDQKGYLFEAARRGIAESVQRRRLRAEPVLPAFARENALCLHQLKWDPAILRENHVTIVIPTKNRADLLRTCLASLARTVPIESVEVVVVDDSSDEPEAVAFLAEITSRTDLRCRVIRVPADAGGFNYSRLVNLGTAEAKTPLVLHLNNDVEALQSGWLEDMAGWLSAPGVGIVGAKLLYPDETINHAGIGLSREDGLAHLLFEKEPAADFGYLFLTVAARNVSAVTGACLLTRTSLYHELGGFDAERLRVAYNDVDFCLRAQAAGHRVVFSPQAVLRHLGSASRGNTYAEREHVAFLERHAGYRDPYHSESLSFPPHNLPLNPYHQRYAETPRPFRVLVLTQNLNFEGAPIFAFELARYLAGQPGVTVEVVSSQEGPLREKFAGEQLSVTVWNTQPLYDARTPDAFASALQALGREHPCEDVDVILGNTLLTFWGVPFAALLGKSSALYVHESRSVKRFFDPLLPVALHATVEAAFRQATRVVFTARATREIFEELNENDNFRTLNSWVDFERIERFAAAHDKRALRMKHGLDPDAIIVANIGSVYERKGQHIYIRGIDLLRKELVARYPGRTIQWVMVGARPGLYMETLAEDIRLMGLDELKIFPETADIYDFYRLTDILVCTSFEESFPRVLLEAMVFGNRIVSTDVNGITEMLTGNDEAYLVPAGDAFKLAAALRLALDDHCAGRNKMLSMAYARAARNYHQGRALPQHLQMLREAWLG